MIEKYIQTLPCLSSVGSLCEPGSLVRTVSAYPTVNATANHSLLLKSVIIEIAAGALILSRIGMIMMELPYFLNYSCFLVVGQL
jgi:hypothetical protein